MSQGSLEEDVATDQFLVKSETVGGDEHRGRQNYTCRDFLGSFEMGVRVMQMEKGINGLSIQNKPHQHLTFNCCSTHKS